MTNSVVEATVVIRNKMGLHARPATQLVKLAQSFNAEITLIKQDKSASATSVLGIMMLGSHSGESITVQASGADAQAALDSVIALISCEFDD